MRKEAPVSLSCVQCSMHVQVCCSQPKSLLSLSQSSKTDAGDVPVCLVLVFRAERDRSVCPSRYMREERRVAVSSR